ncbi:hypothetical protein MRB53_041832 [Persea americana]|nr:hypothetical protein MRB53_041832 [Persea americana]
MTLYGAIPFMQAHKKDSTVGVFWLNAAETWIDIVKAKEAHNPLSLGIGAKDRHSHALVLRVRTGGRLRAFRTNAASNEQDDGKKYFTFDPLTFSDPAGMQKQLEVHQRKLVAIIDPHIKKEDNYHVIKEMQDKDLAVHNKNGEQYEGWCWPGASYWIDAFNPAAIKWWTTLFTYDRWKGATSNLFLWNDMNEPSVFNGPETTMPKDNLHHGGWEHRDVHNLNGMTFHNATFAALKARDKVAKRPFILTRSFFAGSQRLGAVWTGDNQASWPHLEASIPMLLANNLAGYPFVGADVGGFFGNPEKELLTRWYQAGSPSAILAPTGMVYSIPQRCYDRSAQSCKPQYYVHPSDPVGFAIDDQFTVSGTGLLAKPVTSPDTSSVNIYLADARAYYDYFTYTTYTGAAGRTVTVPAPLDTIPLLMRAGHIFPRRERPRRSSGLMKYDPVTLVVVLDEGRGDAQGELYMDDGESYDYESGASVHRLLRLLRSERAHSQARTLARKAS